MSGVQISPNASADASQQASVVAELVHRDRPRQAVRAAMQYHAAIFALAALVLIAALTLDVLGGTQVIVPIVGLPLPEVCAWHRLTGMNCPGCGLTRSFIALAQGDLRRGWDYNPAGVLLFAGLLVQFPYRGAQLGRLMTGRAAWRPAGAWVVVWVLAGCLVLQWVWRITLPS